MCLEKARADLEDLGVSLQTSPAEFSHKPHRHLPKLQSKFSCLRLIWGWVVAEVTQPKKSNNVIGVYHRSNKII